MRFLTALSLCFAALASGRVGQWHSYTNKSHVTSLIEYQGRLIVGTTGGIRSLDLTTLTGVDYGNLEGLVEASIVGLVVSPSNRLWAASRSGFLYEWDGSRWHDYGRSYVSERWRSNERAIVAAGKYLAIGTEKGLSFFDTEAKVARVNLVKFSRQANVSVFSVLRSGDTLFIGTEKGAFKALIDWNDIMSSRHTSIFDPAAWSEVDIPIDSASLDSPSDSSLTLPDPEPVRSYNHLAFVDGILRSFSKGTVLSEPYQVRALLDKPLKFKGKVYPELKGFTAAVVIGTRVYLGGQEAIGFISDANKSTPAKPLFFFLIPGNVPPDTLLNISASQGGAVSMSGGGLFRLKDSVWQRDPVYGLGYSSDIIFYKLRNLSLDTDGAAYIGSWGAGIVQEKGIKQQAWNSSNIPCIDTVINNYTVIRSVSAVVDGSFWATILKKENAKAYDLIRLDVKTGKVNCLDKAGRETNTHRVKVLSNSIVGVAGEAGTDLFKYSLKGGFKVEPWMTIGLGSSVNESWDLEGDAYGRVWSLMAGNLVYLDSLEKAGASPVAKTFEGFGGKECFQMEADASGSIWMGCSNGLFRLTPAASVENSQSERFTLDDGLLSYQITDLSVDKSNGRIWIATDLGISMYESEGRPAAQNVDHLKVYPNPFRPWHKFVVFDNLPKGSRIRIHTQSGSVVRSYASADVKGGQCQWDGLNASGNKVKPGIYLYSVDGGSATKRGKIIVAR